MRVKNENYTNEKRVYSHLKQNSMHFWFVVLQMRMQAPI